MTSATLPARRRRKWRIAIVVLVLVLVLAGCGQQVAPYWPSLTVEGSAGDGIVYVTQANGQVFALSSATGAVQWAYPAAAERQGGLLSGCSPSSASDGPFHAPPAVGPEKLYLGSAGEKQQSIFGGANNRAGLRALNTLGTLQWDWRGTVERSVTSPGLSDTTAYLPSSDHNVYAIDLATQQPRWTFATKNWVWATPLLAQDRVYIASMDHSLYAVDDANGALIWEFQGNPGALPASPALSSPESAAPGLLYFGSLGGHVYAVRAQDGKPEWEAELDHGVWASPRLVEDEERGISALYVGTLNGTVYAFDPKDGSELWTAKVPGEIRGTPAYVAAPDADEATLYVGHEDGRLYAFDAQTGKEVASPLGQQLESGSLFASPVFDGQYLYVVATSGEVFALDPERSTVVWQTNPLERAREDK